MSTVSSNLLNMSALKGKAGGQFGSCNTFSASDEALADALGADDPTESMSEESPRPPMMLRLDAEGLMRREVRSERVQVGRQSFKDCMLNNIK